jgi:hypothetical protein
VSDIACGPTSERKRNGEADVPDSVVIDRSKLYYMAGKWKITGDGEHAPQVTSEATQEAAERHIRRSSELGCLFSTIWLTWDQKHSR